MSLRDYLQKLSRLILLEREAEIEEMKKEMMNLPGQEREKLGRAILNLDGKIVKREFDYKIVRYKRETQIKTDIEVGDLVLISKENPLMSSLYGVVVEKKNYSISVALEYVPDWALEKVRIDLGANDITFRRQLENLQNLTPFGFRALEFLLKKRKPRKSHPLNFEPLNIKLNKAQKTAVSLALGSKDFFLIHGPFGTGKTTALVELILQEVKKGHKVLATAESNVAVDNLCERLWKMAKIVRIGHPSRVSKSLKKTTLSFLAEKSPEYKKILELRKIVDSLILRRNQFLKPTSTKRRGFSKSKILKLAKKGKTARGLKIEEIKEMANWIETDKSIKRLLKAIKEIERKIVAKIIFEAEVVLTTNSSVFLDFLKKIKFDVAVIDEASQATIPSCLIPVCRAKKFILAGDHKQLPPTILSPKAKELSQTLFEKLITIYPKKAKMLEIQYRMNSLLMEFPSSEFYNGKVKSSKQTKGITLKELGIKKFYFDPFLTFIFDFKKPLIFIDTKERKDKFEFQKPKSTSRENYLEAKIVEKIVKNLLKIGIKKDWLGIITPYDDQVDLIKKILKNEEIEVKSVDGFQGREKEIIIISFVRSNKQKEIGFLEDERRLNVALTRAKRKLILIGDSETLKTNNVYKKLIDFCKNKEGYLIWK